MARGSTSIHVSAETSLESETRARDDSGAGFNVAKLLAANQCLNNDLILHHALNRYKIGCIRRAATFGAW